MHDKLISTEIRKFWQINFDSIGCDTTEPTFTLTLQTLRTYNSKAIEKRYPYDLCFVNLGDSVVFFLFSFSKVSMLDLSHEDYILSKNH